MPLYSSNLETVLRRYIDNFGREGRDRLRKLLNNESVDARYELLMNVRGSTGRSAALIGLIIVALERGALAGIHAAAWADDVETVRYMLDNFSAYQKYDVVKIQDSNEYTALHYAAERGYTSIINYLLSNLSQQQKYDLLKTQDDDGDTPLHTAAINKKVEAAQAITSFVSLPLLIQLLNIKNMEDQTVTDIRPELYDELPVLKNQSRSTESHQVLPKLYIFMIKIIHVVVQLIVLTN